MENATLQVALIAVSALIGSLLGSFSSLATTWINKKSEERKHYRELIINLAVENYKEERLMARTLLERRPEIDQQFTPLSIYVIYMSKLAELIIDKKIQPGAVKESLIEIDKVTEEAITYLRNKKNTHT